MSKPETSQKKRKNITADTATQVPAAPVEKQTAKKDKGDKTEKPVKNAENKPKNTQKVVAQPKPKEKTEAKPEDDAKKAAQKQKNKEVALRRGVASDPSLKYYFTPLDTPIINEAKEFFAKIAADVYRPIVKPVGGVPHKPAANSTVPEFKVVMNAQSKWRSLAKLAVRCYGYGYVPMALRPREIKPTTTDPLEDIAEGTETAPKKKEKKEKSTQGPLNKPNGSSAEAAIAQLESKKALSRSERKLLNALREGKPLPYEHPAVGIFLPGTHDIAPDIEQCPAHHPAINHALAAVKASIFRTETKGYNDSTGEGHLRYIGLSVATQSLKEEDRNKVQLTLVWNAAGSDAEKPASFDTPAIPNKLPDGKAGLEYVQKNHPELYKLIQDLRIVPKKVKNKSGFHPLWHSIHVNYNNAWSHTNTIYSFDPNSWQHLLGPTAVQEVLPVVALPVLVDDEYNCGKLGFANEASLPAAAAPATTSGSFSRAGANKKVVFDAVEPAKPEPKVEAEQAPKKDAKAEKPATEEKESVKDVVLARPTLCFPPTVFRQANLEGFTRIISSLRQYIPSQSRLVELYGGVGTIGLSVLDRVEYLVCSDENPNNEKAFYTALETVDGVVRDGKAAKYIPKNANDMVAAGALSKSLVMNTDKFKYYPPAPGSKKPDLRNVKREKLTPTDLLPPNVCLVDPPRKGLDSAVLDALALPKLKLPSSGVAGLKKNNQPEGTYLDRLIYVSCGFKALMRDCQQLTTKEGGGWKIQHAEGHVLFPGADHIETLVVFVR